MLAVFSLTSDQLIENTVKISHLCVNSDYMLTVFLCYFHHHVMPSEVLYFVSNPVTTGQGRAIAQAVSRWLPTVAARVRARVWSCGICGRQSGAGACFLRVLWFPLPIFIPPIAPQSPSSIIWGLYNRPEVAAVPSGLSPTPLIIIIKKKLLGRVYLSSN
jgi:hypothetical protein